MQPWIVWSLSIGVAMGVIWLSGVYVNNQGMAGDPVGMVIDALADLFWTFFPVLVVVVVLALVDRLSHLADRSDLLLGASVLFADGWWRTRSNLHGKAAGFEFLGFLGTVLTVLLASLVLFVEAGQITQLAPVTASPLFSNLQFVLLLSSLLYGYVVRIRVAVKASRRTGGVPFDL